MPSQKHPKEGDVIVGKRHKRYSNLPGIIAFQKMVKDSCPKYHGAKSQEEKRHIIQLIVEKVERRGGRFIKMNKKRTSWVKADEFSASERIRQAMSVLWHKGGLKAQYSLENSITETPKKAIKSTFTSKEKSSPKSAEILRKTPKDADVVAGIHSGFFNHPGNIRLRELAEEASATYIDESVPKRKVIVDKILEEVRSRGGNFIKMSDDGSHWVPTGDSIARAQIRNAIKYRRKVASAPKTNGTSLRKADAKQLVKKHSIAKFSRSNSVAKSRTRHSCSSDVPAYQFDRCEEPFYRTQKKVEEVLELTPAQPNASSVPSDLTNCSLMGNIKSEAELTYFLTNDSHDGDTKKIAIELQHALGFIEKIGVETEHRSIVYHNILGVAHRYPEDPTIQCICLEILTKSLERFDPPHGADVGDSRVAVKALKSFELHEELQKLAIGFLSTVIDRDFAKEHSSVILDEDGLLHLCTAATRYSEDAPVLCDVFSIFSSMLDCGAEILDELLRFDMFSVADKSLEQFPGNKRLRRRVGDLRKHLDAVE